MYPGLTYLSLLSSNYATESSFLFVNLLWHWYLQVVVRQYCAGEKLPAMHRAGLEFWAVVIWNVREIAGPALRLQSREALSRSVSSQKFCSYLEPQRKEPTNLVGQCILQNQSMCEATRVKLGAPMNHRRFDTVCNFHSRLSIQVCIKCMDMRSSECIIKWPDEMRARTWETTRDEE